MPAEIIPPIAPIRMIGMGMSSPRPINIGFRKVSLKPATSIHTVKIAAGVVG